MMLHLLNNLNRDKFQITFVLLEKSGNLLSYIPGDIRVISYNYARTINATFEILKLIRRLRPQIVFSTLSQVNLLLSLLIPFIPRTVRFVARESSIISENNKNYRYPAIFNFLYKTTFKRFHSVVCQSESMKDDMIENFGVPSELIRVINNPIDFKVMPAPDYSTGTSLPVKLITVGRLRPEKGHERLIRALARCETPYQYDIIGDGPLRQQLETLIVDLGVSDKIRILGEIPMPYDHLVKADLFLQGSFYEGFPNAVIEANACGIPVVAWKAPGGHTEIIVQNVNGWIFASEAELMEILSREKFRSLDKHAIVDLTRSRYDLPQVVAKYEQHFYDVIEQSN